MFILLLFIIIILLLLSLIFSWYIYIFVYMHTYIYMYIYIHLYVYVYVCHVVYIHMSHGIHVLILLSHATCDWRFLHICATSSVHDPVFAERSWVSYTTKLSNFMFSKNVTLRIKGKIFWYRVAARHSLWKSINPAKTYVHTNKICSLQSRKYVINIFSKPKSIN